MNKQSLVHVHGLLVQIRHDLQNCGDVPADAYGAYDEQNVTPMSIHRRKGAHRRAIDLLTDGLLRTIDHQRGETALENGDRSLPSSVDDWELPEQ